MPNAPLWDLPLIWYWLPFTPPLVKSWMNWSFLNPRNNIPTHYLFHFNKLEASLLWAPHFGHETPLENQLTLGNVVIYPRWLRLILHPSAHDYHNWSTWPSIGPILFFSLLTPYLGTSLCHHEALIYLGAICICSNLYFYYLGWHCCF